MSVVNNYTKDPSNLEIVMFDGVRRLRFLLTSMGKSDRGFAVRIIAIKLRRIISTGFDILLWPWCVRRILCYFWLHLFWWQSHKTVFYFNQSRIESSASCSMCLHTGQYCRLIGPKSYVSKVKVNVASAHFAMMTFKKKSTCHDEVTGVQTFSNESSIYF